MTPNGENADAYGVEKRQVIFFGAGGGSDPMGFATSL